ncbi:AbiU2 domain-containing protein, partial [Vibrio parahaemolyticus]|uniref:AbiU2 domain-containing protein n=1 Tax=Vibrio parahaemolyticus TaxID=670 RepID=UPI001C5FD3D1
VLGDKMEEDVVLFKKKLSDVSLNFTVYTELFDSTEAVKAMNDFHPFIFGNYQKCLVDGLYLELTKLFDPQGKSGSKNLSFDFMISRVSKEHQTELRADLQELGKLFEEANLKKYRNKLLAHNDVNALRGSKVIELRVTTLKLEMILSSLWSLFGKIEYYLGITDRPYKTSSYIRLPTGSSVEEFVGKIIKRT